MRDVMVGARLGPAEDAAAKLAVRSALVEGRAFVPLSDWDDADVAQHFGLPLDQVPGSDATFAVLSVSVL
jgi:hypothetical protein